MGKFTFFILVLGAIGYGLTMFSESDSAKNSIMNSFAKEKTVKSVQKSRDANKGTVDRALNVNNY